MIGTASRLRYPNSRGRARTQSHHGIRAPTDAGGPLPDGHRCAPEDSARTSCPKSHSRISSARSAG